MTVHGAKGLEAPVVILPDSTGDVGDAPDNGLYLRRRQGPFVSFSAKGDDEPRSPKRARAQGSHAR
jgi:ATP-dependent helicase/nuclease subunit A